jgi:serine/threonine protein kinase
MPSALPSPWRHHGDNVQPRESGQAFVFKVCRPDDTASYALKRLKNADRRARFEREIEAMRAVNADGLDIVPTVVDAGVDSKGRPYYVMPWYDDGSLDDAILSGRFGGAEAGLQILLQLVDALDGLHSCGWTHRDLKPANILLNGERLVLCDLGLTLPVGAESDGARLTDTMEAVGSRYYIAPENESGISDEVDQRPADFYAFGKISWVVLTGHRPLAREAQLETPNRLGTIADGELAAWDEVCEQLLRRDPRTRLADWAAVRTELRALLRDLGNPPTESSQAPTELEALAFAAKRFARSSAAAEVLASRAALAEHQQQIASLRKEVSAAASSDVVGLNINESSGGLVQATISTYTEFTVRLLITSGGLDGLPELAGHAWDQHCLETSCAAFMQIDGLFYPRPFSAFLGGYVLTDQTHAWMLRIPFLARWEPALFRLLPTMTARFRSISGPYRLGLPSATQAARALGADVFATGLTLAREYINLLIDGRPVDHPDSWIATDERQ